MTMESPDILLNLEQDKLVQHIVYFSNWGHTLNYKKLEQREIKASKKQT